MDEKVMVLQGERFKQEPALIVLGEPVCQGCHFYQDAQCTGDGFVELEREAFGKGCVHSKSIYVKAE